VISRQQNGLSYLQFHGLVNFPELVHGVFTRHTGYSQPPFQSLNVATGIGDDHHAVVRNRKLIARTLDCGELVFTRQTHGCQVLVLDRGDRLMDRPTGSGQRFADAVVTNLAKTCLVIQVADCQSVVLYDPQGGAIANIHSGWRGSIQNIIGRTVETMVTRFGCRPESIRAAIGPSLGPCCAEFVNYRSEIPRQFWSYKDDRDHFDFWAMSADQLKACGIRREHIDHSRICTKCRTDLFFSYRGEGTTGRFASVVGLRRSPSD
jgi:purine-nucleoside/S-methyl-5'-thioadenosine phosphorylase / adenosine deaminase